jgi:hypothetical protein
LCVALLGFAVIGCGSGSGVATAKVKGNVKVAGAPMAGIMVTFAPESGGRASMGLTDSSGNYELSTYGNGDGAVPGKHKVVFAMENAAPASNLPGDLTTAAPATPFNAKYLSGDTSGIVEDVVAGKTNEFSWDLEK